MNTTVLLATKAFDGPRFAYLVVHIGMPALTEPPSKRQRVERTSSQPPDVPAATTQPADPDSAGGSSFHPAGSTPMSGSAVPDTAGGPRTFST
ncbi:hypothetical protein Tco_0391952 [Tanacetum coccineum]